MIRPWTAISFVLAAGAVLYTYRSKHEVQLLDRQIEKTLADTAGLREQSRALQAEWTLRENPERLRTFADQFLSLKPMLPTQFTTLADLDTRLPAPRAMPLNTGTTEEPAEAPVASTVPPAPSPDETFAEAEELPIPPLHVPPPPSMAPSMAMAANAVPAAPKPAPPRPAILQAAAPVPAPVQAPPIQPQPARMAATQAPPAQARPPLAPVPMQQPQVQTGSLLGIGRGGSYAPAPRPIPISSTLWTNGN
jgi:hypothetical protein